MPQIMFMVLGIIDLVIQLKAAAVIVTKHQHVLKIVIRQIKCENYQKNAP